MTSKIIAIILLIITFPFFTFISIIILLSDKTPIIFKQKRVGLNNQHFFLYKFRTMRNDTPDIATHLLKNPENYFIKYGSFFRKSSLDELPQLFNIIKGDMVFIGPRPALFNQYDLIKFRKEYGVHKLLPGITGWAQVNGRDSISIQKKVIFEKYYIDNKSFFLDVKILVFTIIKVFFRTDVNH
tara:strand:+ start:117 stop:668 length:552 start_codon:yes stop_codon:yes gene_type:complete